VKNITKAKLYVPKKTSFACFQRFFEPLLCLYFNFVEIVAKGKFLLAKRKFLLANGSCTNLSKKTQNNHKNFIELESILIIKMINNVEY
jgi:hypothetical protein